MIDIFINALEKSMFDLILRKFWKMGEKKNFSLKEESVDERLSVLQTKIDGLQVVSTFTRIITNLSFPILIFFTTRAELAEATRRFQID